MSRETFMQPAPEINEGAMLEPVDTRPEHDPPPEIFMAELASERDELLARLTMLKDIIGSHSQRGTQPPAAIVERCQRLTARYNKIVRQLGRNDQLDINFSAEESRPTSRAA